MGHGDRALYVKPRSSLLGSLQTPPSGGWVIFFLNGFFILNSKCSSLTRITYGEPYNLIVVSQGFPLGL
jgi:hypothetical protein